MFRTIFRINTYSACSPKLAWWNTESLRCMVNQYHVKRFSNRSATPVTLAHEPYASISPWLPFIPPAPESGPADARPWAEIMCATQPAPTLVDVRSPAEFAQDHIPGAINLPVLNDEQRVEIGRLHAQGNILKARMEGAALICANISRMLTELSRQCFAHSSDRTSSNDDTPLSQLRLNPSLLIYCWRGGQRSNSLATILSEIGWPAPVQILVGGYRSWRRLVLRQLDAWPRWNMPGQFWVVSGLTGSGKSLVLQELANAEELVLDLEQLANHKGSLFGSNLDHSTTEPATDSASRKVVTQKQFETELHRTLTADTRWISRSQVIWIECESRSVGPHCRLGDSLWTRLRATDQRWGAHRVWLDVPEQARVDWIIRSYAQFTTDHDALEPVFSVLSRYHSDRRISEWRSYTERADYVSFVQGLLRHHYDPLYEKSRNPIIAEAEKNQLLHKLHVPVVDVNTVRNVVVPRLLDLAYTVHKKPHRLATI